MRTVTISSEYAPADTLYRKRGRCIGYMRVDPDGLRIIGERGEMTSYLLPNGATEVYEEAFERERDGAGRLTVEERYFAAWCRLPQRSTALTGGDAE